MPVGEKAGDDRRRIEGRRPAEKKRHQALAEAVAGAEGMAGRSGRNKKPLVRSGGVQGQGPSILER